MTVTALVLAGVRPGGDPLAEFAGVSHKALIPIGGVAMLDRVVNALRASGRVGRIAVSIDRPELVTTPDVEVFRSKASLSESVADAFGRLGAPLFVTTADHALLEPEWVGYFLDHVPDVAVTAALARDTVVMAATPDTKRTFLKLADGGFSGCNMFFFRDMAAIKAIEMWRSVEALRKRPLKLLKKLGPRAILDYSLGRLTLARGVAAIERLSGVSAGVVEMPFGRAAVDVDKPADLILVRRLVETN
ncbi:MAG TPA: NTP transferase domain-containing protein [Hansschlegelia sp.]